MEITKTLYVTERKDWRAWLKKHHASEKEIWLVYYTKQSGKPRIPYNDSVEEALCFGWIDSIVKKMDANSFAQRFSPRRKGSQLSPMNQERIRRLIKQKKMTPAGLAAVKDSLKPSTKETKTNPRLKARLVIAPDIRQALKADEGTWKNFQKFPASYKRIRIGWIEGARKRPEEFRKRLAYFLKMTAQNKRFGMVQ